MSTVVITGGAGFIGAHLARYHVDRGDKVVLLDSLYKSEGKNDPDFEVLCAAPGVRFVQLDLRKPITDLEIDHPDLVYHLAAINGTQLFYDFPYLVASTNVATTLNLLDWLEQHPPGNLIYASSSEVYADAESLGQLKIPTDESAPVLFTQPTNARFSYGTSKFMGEFLVLSFGKAFHVRSTVVRYHNIYGPRMGMKHVIPEFIQRIKTGENPFRIYGGTETRSFCYVDDAVKATHLAAEAAECANEIVHVGNSQEEVQIQELAMMMMDLMNVRLPIQEQGRRSGSVSRRCPDTSKLFRLTGFQSSIKLREGLQKTIEWYTR